MKQRFVHAALFSAFLFVTDKAQAQYDEAARNYRLWRVESSMGYALPSGPGNKSGLLLSLEPKYNFTDQLSFGLRTEATALARGYVDINGNSFSGKAALGLSFLGTTDYFFTQTLLRPFTGAGIGVYNLVGAEI
ncbi:MAG TPA: hypothetical protein PKE63_07535, partial [Lacibacter sp.]|nr:hypothetical protein [Lacibacter sp.]